MAIAYLVLSILLGLASFASGHPVALPAFGLAFGAAALLRESGGPKRTPVYLGAGVGCTLSSIAVVLTLLPLHP